MSELNKLMHKPNEKTTDLEFAIIVLSEIRKGEAEIAANELAKLKRDLAEAEASRDLHSGLNERIAKAFGLPFEKSWHDLPERVTRLRRDNAALLEALKICVMFLTNMNTITEENQTRLVKYLRDAGQKDLADAVAMSGFAGAVARLKGSE